MYIDTGHGFGILFNFLRNLFIIIINKIMYIQISLPNDSYCRLYFIQNSKQLHAVYKLFTKTNWQNTLFFYPSRDSFIKSRSYKFIKVVVYFVF